MYISETQEIGYTDTIIDVRSNRVRSLLGLHDNAGGGGGELGGGVGSGTTGAGGDDHTADQRTGALNGGQNSQGEKSYEK